MTKAVIISDLHLTNESTDEYRWDVFDRAEEQIKERSCDALFILGDVFDKKDRHPSSIVNRLTDRITKLAQQVPITILKGNHDYIEPTEPFLRFLDHIANVSWINEPTLKIYNDLRVGWLPHSRTPTTEWPEFLKNNTFDLIFMHQSVIGSKTSNDFEINHALPLAWLEEQVNCPIISGDIHVPQTISRLMYVGTQHPVSYGDSYNYRMLILPLKTPISARSIPVQAIKRHSIRVSNTDDLEYLMESGKLRKGDQAKIKIDLTEETLGDWVQAKNETLAWCAANHIQVEDVKLNKIAQTTPLVDQESKSTPATDPHRALSVYIDKGIDPAIAQIGTEILTEVLNETITH